MPASYACLRRQLLAACKWNRWAAERGYSPRAAAHLIENQRALAALRAARRLATQEQHPI